VASESSQESIAGNALAFDGDGDYVDIGTPDALKLSEFTLSTWFKRSGDGTTVTTGTGGVIAEPLVTKGRGESDGSNVDMNYFLGITQSGVLVADFEDNHDGTNHPITGDSPVTDNVWHHAAVTYDGSTLKLYLDGDLDEAISVNMTPRSDSVQYNAIGSALDSSGTPSGYFNGEIDEVRIWNTARSQAEIQAYMNSTLSGTESNLVAYYQFDESSSNTASDATGSYDGTLNGDPQWVTSDASLTEMAPPGNALSFDGADDYIILNNTLTLNNTYTVEGWFKTSNTDSQDIISFVDSSENHYALIEQTNGIMRFLHRVPPGVSGGTNIYSSAGYADNTWHHFACVKDAT